MSTKNAALIAAIGIAIGLVASLVESFRMIRFYSPESWAMFSAFRAIVSSAGVIYFFITFYKQSSAVGASGVSVSPTPTTAEKPPTAPAATSGRKNLAILLIVIGAAALFWVYNRMTSFTGRLCSWSPPFNNYETVTIAAGSIALLCVAVGLMNVMTKPKNKK